VAAGVLCTRAGLEAIQTGPPPQHVIVTAVPELSVKGRGASGLEDAWTVWDAWRPSTTQLLWRPSMLLPVGRTTEKTALALYDIGLRLVTVKEANNVGRTNETILDNVGVTIDVDEGELLRQLDVMIPAGAVNGTSGGPENADLFVARLRFDAPGGVPRMMSMYNAVFAVLARRLGAATPTSLRAVVGPVPDCPAPLPPARVGRNVLNLHLKLAAPTLAYATWIAAWKPATLDIPLRGFDLDTLSDFLSKALQNRPKKSVDFLLRVSSGDVVSNAMSRTGHSAQILQKNFACVANEPPDGSAGDPHWMPIQSPFSGETKPDRMFPANLRGVTCAAHRKLALFETRTA
jgi:hypothetical protein